jgi:hypothetical protein
MGRLRSDGPEAVFITLQLRPSIVTRDPRLRVPGDDIHWHKAIDSFHRSLSRHLALKRGINWDMLKAKPLIDGIGTLERF